MFRKTTLALLAAAAFAACGDDSGTTKKDASVNGSIFIYLDAAPAVNGAMIDAAPVDAGPRPDAAVIPLDGGNNLTGTCAAPINLNTMGTTAGGVTTISGNNGGAPMAPPTDVVGPSCATDTGGNHASYAVDFTYTMATSAHLRAGTAVAGTSTAFDSIVWIVDACGSSANELACNDEAARTDSRSMAFTPASIPSGTTVHIMVSGYTPPTSGDTNRAPFTLEVAELMENAAGAACTTSNPFCVSGYSCIIPTGGVAGTCVQDGTLNGECRITGTACDGTMRCSVDVPSATNRGVCQEPLPLGTACTSTMFVCTAGAHCTLDTGGVTTTTCRMDGAEGGQCLLTMPYCSTTLRCSRDTPTATRPGQCSTPLADGALCYPATSSCVVGDHCVRDAGSTTGHCLADGTLGGRCLPSGTCNSGFTCMNNTCH